MTTCPLIPPYLKKIFLFIGVMREVIVMFKRKFKRVNDRSSISGTANRKRLSIFDRKSKTDNGVLFRPRNSQRNTAGR